MPGLNLTREEAQQRANIVKPSQYRVELDLTRGDRVFGSVTTIDFTASAEEETFVDLVADKVNAITLNGATVEVSRWEDNRISLPSLAEQNTLVVDAECLYMHTGEGLHRFVDPADSEAYCYSQFEVPDARRVFATFEQPDLKASFVFSVTVPQGWMVFSNSPTPDPVALEESDSVRFDFAPTEVISTYITAIIAGPYTGETSSLVSSNGKDIPLGVYCRKSLVKDLDAEAIFDVTRKGFAFFEDAYGIPYPFTKYDQIFVPEYNAGAMENAGCITYRDQYIFRTNPTAWQLEVRANTILHELAHMWFGDLVTMAWWNDLWLNESFAEFMSHLALAEGTEWTDAWTGFLSRKEWGLDQDQLPSTHPIKAEIRDLADVEVNFDGITYAKGASVLRQLVSYVGREAFFQGLHEYLQKHSYANATLDDLLSELEKASGRDLAAWSKVWLEEAGVTTLRPSIEIDPEGNITELAVLQEAFTPSASLRPHRLAVAGYDLSQDGSTVKQVFRQELDVEGERTLVTDATGRLRPSLVLVNDGDLAYAKLRLDQSSLKFAITNIDKFEDALTRRVLLSCAWDMTRDAEMSATQYLDLALTAIPAETSISTLTSVLNHIDKAVTCYVSPHNREERMEIVADRLLLLAKTAPAETDQQRLLVESFTRRAVSSAQFDTIENLYNGEMTLLGLSMDVDLKWLLLIALVRGGRADDLAVSELLKEDTTLTGEQNAQRARASVDSDMVREEAWRAVMHDTAIANDTRWAIAAGFWAHARTKPLAYTRYVEEYFDQLASVWAEHTFHMASGIVEIMYPTLLAGYVPELDIATRSEKWLADHQDQADAHRRLVTEQQADAQRMLAAQKCDGTK